MHPEFQQRRAADGQDARLGGGVGGEEDVRVLRGGGLHGAEADRVGLAGEDVDFDGFVGGRWLRIRRRKLDGNDIGGGGQRGEKESGNACQAEEFHGERGVGLSSAS